MAKTRLLAVYAIHEVLKKGSSPKMAVEKQSTSLDRRDRAFLMELVYGAIRFRDTLDWVLAHFLQSPAKLGGLTRDNLRTALYQIFFMRVPEWAVVHESVEIEKREILHGKPALVNAVLRNVIRQKNRFVFPLRMDDPAESISVNTSHPQWLVERWIRRFGAEEAALVGEANNRIPPLTIRVNQLKTSRSEVLHRLQEKGITAHITRYSPDGIVLEEGVTFEDIAFLQGLFMVQDEASQLVSYLLNPKPGERILDACSAPGGKTTHIAQLMNDHGEIVAVERDRERSVRLRGNIRSMGIKSVKVVEADFAELKPMGIFDRILVDAPCSAMGTIRKNPDVKYRHKAGDLLEFSKKQTDLLLSARDHVKAGGTVVYSVCSTEPEENEKVASTFLNTSDDFGIIGADAVFLKDFMSQGFMRTYPHKHGMDGFFGVIFCRKK